MIKIILPSEFKNIPWKNGLGVTTELAINKGGTVQDFDWRLSIASVVEDGVFSDFSGYLRQLVLIQGNGITLTHSNNKVDRLDELLDVATFDGANKTIGSLHDGSIKDFNIMTKASKLTSTVKRIIAKQAIELPNSSLCFIFGIKNNTVVIDEDNVKTMLPQGHLMQINNKTDKLILSAENAIIITIDKKENKEK
jgi:environmental stress-induced protein Ves